MIGCVPVSQIAALEAEIFPGVKMQFAAKFKGRIIYDAECRVPIICLLELYFWPTHDETGWPDYN